MFHRSAELSRLHGRLSANFWACMDTRRYTPVAIVRGTFRGRQILIAKPWRCLLATCVCIVRRHRHADRLWSCRQFHSPVDREAALSKSSCRGSRCRHCSTGLDFQTMPRGPFTGIDFVVAWAAICSGLCGACLHVEHRVRARHHAQQVDPVRVFQLARVGAARRLAGTLGITGRVHSRSQSQVTPCPNFA